MKKILFFVLTVTLMFFVGSCSQKNKPSQKVKEYYESLVRKDYNAASVMMFHDLEVAEKCAHVLKTLNYTVLDYDIVGEEISEGGLEATVKVKNTHTTFYEGQRDTVDATTELTLTKVDGEWVLNPYKMID